MERGEKRGKYQDLQDDVAAGRLVRHSDAEQPRVSGAKASRTSSTSRPHRRTSRPATGAWTTSRSTKRSTIACNTRKPISISYRDYGRGRDLLLLRARQGQAHDGVHRQDGQAQVATDSSRTDQLGECHAVGTPPSRDWHVQEDARSHQEPRFREYDYLAPGALVKGREEADPPPRRRLVASWSSIFHVGRRGGASWTTLGTAEWYEHPALVVQNSATAAAQTTGATAAAQRASVRIDELMSLFSSTAGKTNARDLGTGMTFTLKGTPVDSDDQDYLMVAAFYQLDFTDLDAIDDFKDPSKRHEGYRCDFIAIEHQGTDIPDASSHAQTGGFRRADRRRRRRLGQ